MSEMAKSNGQAPPAGDLKLPEDPLQRRAIVDELEQKYIERCNALRDKIMDKLCLLVLCSGSGRGALGIAMISGMKTQNSVHLAQTICDIIMPLLWNARANIVDCVREDIQALEAVVDNQEKFDLLRRLLAGQGPNREELRECISHFHQLCVAYLAIWFGFLLPSLWADWRPFFLGMNTV